MKGCIIKPLKIIIAGKGWGVFAAFLCSQTQGPVAEFGIGVLTLVRIKVCVIIGYDAV